MIRRIFSITLIGLAVVASTSRITHGEVAPLWNEFVEARAAGQEPTLPDFSYAGYHFCEQPIPDVSNRPRFDVTAFGGAPDDDEFDDAAIQRAIDAAEANENGGVVFFPPGRFKISGDKDSRRAIRISKSNIVLKGSGRGEGGTEIFAVEMRRGRRNFVFRPERDRDRDVTIVSKDSPRASFWVEVADASELEVGENVVLAHQSEEFTRQYFDPLPLARQWERLFGRRGGMNIREIHTVAEIDGNRVRFENPIHFPLKLVASEPFTLRTFASIDECGIEDIRFTGRWDSYPEEFVHHKDGIHDSGWCAITMENVENGWIRRCEFRHWNECINLRAGYKFTIEDVKFTGKKGHTSIHARSGYGVLVKHCVDTAGHHHGPGGGYGAVNLVVTQCQMLVDQNIDLHSGQSYACLYDDIEGGIFRNLGGPHPGLPHGGRDIVFWNFRHRSTFDFDYNFWNTAERRNHTFARPTFVGFQADRSITFENEGVNQLPGANVEPRSLFEAQLALRLKSSADGFQSVSVDQPQ
jgi:Domain of unknown function (DUF4955)/Pectate lyase superfamily protein